MKTNLKILMVEELSTNIQLIHDEITRSGIQFSEQVVSTKKEYQKALQEFKPDVILSDYGLPSLDIMQALSYRTEVAPLTPFIIVPVSATDEIAVDVMKAGADDYIVRKNIKHIGDAIKSAIQKKEAEEKLNMFMQVVKQNNESILIANSDGTIEYSNPDFTRLTGYTSREVVGKNLKDLHADGSWDDEFESLWKTINSGTEWSGEARAERKSGEPYLESTRITPIRGENGAIAHFLIIKKDVTKSREDNNHFTLLGEAFDHCPLSIAITDTSGKIEYSNLRYASGTASIFEKIRGTFPRIFNPDNRNNDGYDMMWKELKAGRIWKQDVLDRKQDGSVFWENVVIYPLRDENENICNYILMSEDITARKTKYDELMAAKLKAEESEHQKSALLNIISYKIRTPMNTIAGFTDLLNDPELDHTKRRQFTDLVTQSNNQLLSIITDLVNINTMESGLETVMEKVINVNSLLKQQADKFKLKAEEQKVALQYKTSLTDQEANIITDETKLTLVLNNLVENALKFTTGGHVEFGCNVKDQMLNFYVEDTGIGIPVKMQEGLFDRYHPTEIPVYQQYSVSGLGLSLSKSYVDLLGGKIWVQSEKGKGSTFYFSIPYTKVANYDLSTKQPSKTSALQFKKHSTVLIAEDEDLNFNLILMILSRMGLKAIRAKNGQEAVELCKSNKDIELVLMDIKMPIMDGYEATRQLKMLKPDLPVIAQTAYSSYDDKQKAFASGCSDFITKPYKREQLFSKISNQLVDAR